MAGVAGNPRSYDGSGADCGPIYGAGVRSADSGVHAFFFGEGSMTINISRHTALAAGAFGLALAAASTPALAQRQSAQEQRKEQTAQIPN